MNNVGQTTAWKNVKLNEFNFAKGDAPVTGSCSCPDILPTHKQCTHTHTHTHTHTKKNGARAVFVLCNCNAVNFTVAKLGLSLLIEE